MAAAADDQPVEEQGDPANVLQPTGTGRRPHARARACPSPPRTSPTSARRSPAAASQISLAAYGAFERSRRPARHLRRVPRQRDRARARVGGCPPAPSCRLPHDLRRRQPLRLPPGHVDGRAAGRRRRARSCATLNPDLTAADVVRAAQGDRAPPAGQRLGPRAGLGDPRRGRRACAARRRSTAARRVSKLTAPSRTAPARRSRCAGAAATPRRAGCVPSGIERYEVYRSADGGALRSSRARRKTRLRRPRPARRRRYRFYTVAVDRAGNRERAANRATSRAATRADARAACAPAAALGGRAVAARRRAAPPSRRRRAALASATSSASDASIALADDVEVGQRVVVAEQAEVHLARCRT